jgi:hypothetical protein
VHAAPFRFPVHPGQSDTLVHFCGRGRPSASPAVEHLNPKDRLDSILRTGALWPFPPYGSNWPVVCFSESDSGGVEALLRFAAWEPWGIVVRRDWVWRGGGGPVWYIRDDLGQATAGLDERTRSWLVKTSPQDNDWLHEREWRLPVDARDRAAVDLEPDAVVAILVGDAAWEPGPASELDLDPVTGDLAIAEQTPRLANVPRWYWDGEKVRELPPVPVRVAGYHAL